MKLYAKAKKAFGKVKKVSQETKTERTFLIIIGIALIVFIALAMAFTQRSTEAPEITNNTGNVQLGQGNQGTGNIVVQEVYLKALRTGVYDKQKITVKKGVPVKLHFSAETNSGCGKFLIMQKFGVQLLSRNGEEQVAQFTPNEIGTFEYSCSMRMFVGKMEVVP